MFSKIKYDNPLIVSEGDTVAFMTPSGDTREGVVGNVQFSESEQRWMFIGRDADDSRISIWGYLDMILEVTVHHER